MHKGHHEVRYYAVVMILLTSAFGLVLTRDIFNLFVFFVV
jgi:formate hydrogenlyase subunit 3/multisubunit Na+/H+ antiporter MnhD subunit